LCRSVGVKRERREGFVLYCRWYCSTRARAPARILRPEFPNPGQTAIKQNKGKRKGRERECVCWEISVESQDISYIYYNGKEVTRDC
jgi:hypothetical protein